MENEACLILETKENNFQFQIPLSNEAHLKSDSKNIAGNIYTKLLKGLRKLVPLTLNTKSIQRRILQVGTQNNY